MAVGVIVGSTVGIAVGTVVGTIVGVIAEVKIVPYLPRRKVITKIILLNINF
jgi:hypothetical protein